MTRHIFFMWLLLSALGLRAQLTLDKQWDKRFGGYRTDYLFSFQQTEDRGYILGGASYSGIGGDKTQPAWDTTYVTTDYWVIKIDSIGNKQWDNRFGGIDVERFSCVAQTFDGGYIVSGTSYSGINGDKTQDSWGSGDYWIVKIDHLGHIQWDRRYGGTDDDGFTSLWPTNDGGYILGGYSLSGIGGDKTQDNWNPGSFYNDFWMVKIDSSGTKQWDKRFGGLNEDDMTDLQQTSDGGYILGGYSASDSGGDKTHNLWGSSDYWVIKIDSLGNKQWDRDFGGNNRQNFSSLQQTIDGGYILGGSSASPVSGDKTSPNCDVGGGFDYWIVKIDSAGNKQWDKDFGGDVEDDLMSVFQTSDTGYLLAGSSRSTLPSCDKTENNLGLYQTWIVKTDYIGNKQWDKTLFTYGSNAGYAIQTKDGCYAFANATYGNVGGYKTQPSWGVGGDSSFDYWIVKFCFDSLTGLIGVTPETQLSIYPNPFTTDLNILLQKQDLKQATFTITNPLGQIIYTKLENNLSPSYTKMLDLSYLPAGIYFVMVNVDGETVMREVIKE